MFNQFNQFNPFATTGFGQFPNTPFNTFGWNPQFTPTPSNTPWTNWTNTPWFGNASATTTPWTNTPWTNTPWTNTTTPWTTNGWTNTNPWTGTTWNNGFTGFAGFTPWTNTTPFFGSPWTSMFGTNPWTTTNGWSNQAPWASTFTPWTNGFANNFANTFTPSFTNAANNGFQNAFNFTPTWGATNFTQGNFPFTGNIAGNPVTIDGSDRTGRRGVNFARDAA